MTYISSVMSSELDSARYVSFVSYKKDGTSVATPVWIVPFQNGYAFTTEPHSYKVRRIRHNPQVVISVCDMRGNIDTNASQYHGNAELLGAADTRIVEKLIAKKYWIGVRLLGVISIVKKILRKGSTAGDAAIKITLATNE